jgi:ribonuclease III
LSSRTSSSAVLGALGLPAPPGSIYEQALTHRSYAFERPESIEHNERLEFLGDAILGALVTDLIYRTYPELDEGHLARLRASLVSTQALATLARRLGLGSHMLLGRGERSSGGWDKSSLLADTFEALVGAAYIDRGSEHVAAVLVPLFSARMAEVTAEGGGHDSKTALQEVIVRRYGTMPLYRVASSGPDHAKQFTADVFVENRSYGSGTGHSKKEAEQNAARHALGRMAERPAEGDSGARAS